MHYPLTTVRKVWRYQKG